MGKDILNKELETYEKNKEKLIKEHEGEFVLIKEDDIIDTFKSEKDAIKIGIEKFGDTTFLIKKIERTEHKFNFTSNLIKCDLECHH